MPEQFSEEIVLHRNCIPSLQRYNMWNGFWKNWNLKFVLCVWVRCFHVFDRNISVFGRLEETDFYVSWGNFWALFFSSKTVFYQNCLRMLSKKTFRLLRKIFEGLAILHRISFDQYSDVSFWRESTLIKNSSFEKKEQKTIWFYSKAPPFFENCILFFPSIFCVFLEKNPNS